MTDPIFTKGFLQRQRSGWVYFTDEEDAVNGMPYYQLQSNGNMHRIPTPSRGGRTGDGKGAGGIADAIGGAFFGRDAGVVMGNTGTTAVPISEGPPEITRYLREWLRDQYHLTGVPPELALGVFDRAEAVQAGLMSGENFDQEFWKSYQSAGGSEEDFLTLYGTQPSQQSRGLKAIAQVAGPAYGGDTGEGDFAGRGESSDFRATPGSSAAGAGSKPSDKTSGGSPSLSGSTKTTEPGIGGANGQGETTVPQTPGTYNGTEVSPDLLKEFVESDWRLGWNVAMNRLRNTGAAGIFMDWIMNQANRFLGEYEGIIGAQALAGQTPNVSFTGFLANKGLLDPSQAVQLGDGGVAGSFAQFQEDAASAAQRAATVTQAPAQQPLQPLQPNLAGAGASSSGAGASGSRSLNDDFIRRIAGG